MHYDKRNTRTHKSVERTDDNPGLEPMETIAKETRVTILQPWSYMIANDNELNEGRV